MWALPRFQMETNEESKPRPVSTDGWRFRARTDGPVEPNGPKASLYPMGRKVLLSTCGGNQVWSTLIDGGTVPERMGQLDQTGQKPHCIRRARKVLLDVCRKASLVSTDRRWCRARAPKRAKSYPTGRKDVTECACRKASLVSTDR
jgi:hypothetical protein